MDRQLTAKARELAQALNDEGKIGVAGLLVELAQTIDDCREAAKGSTRVLNVASAVLKDHYAGSCVKLLELRDEGTFIVLLCVDMNPKDWRLDVPTDAFGASRFLLRRVGYPCDGRPNIVITAASADGRKASNDPYYWGDRTYAVAHDFIIKNWHSLKDGDVVDVQHILGETSAPKQSERLSDPVPT